MHSVRHILPNASTKEDFAMKKNSIFFVTSLIAVAAWAQSCGDNRDTPQPDKIIPKNACRDEHTLTVYKSADVSYELPCKYGCVAGGDAADDYCNTACPDEEGKIKCDEENAKKLLVCKNGYWLNKSDCKFGCSGSACNTRPSDWCDDPDELKCDNDELIACSADNKLIMQSECAKCLNVNNEPVCIKDSDSLDNNKNGIYDVFEQGFEFEKSDGVFLNGTFKKIACESNAQCSGYHQICLFADSCARKCKSDYSCIDGYKCTKSGICRKPGDKDGDDSNANGIPDIDEPEFNGTDFAGKACKENADCNADQMCPANEKCASKCVDDDSCIDGYKCRRSGICRPIGENDADINLNGIPDADEPEFNGTEFIAKACQQHADCNADQTCLNNGKCASKCVDGSSCLDGYKCRASGLCSADGFAFSFPVAKGAKILLPSWQYKNCNFKIDWGDGSGTTQYTNCPTELSHEYDKDFESVTVTIDGSLDGFAFISKNDFNTPFSLSVTFNHCPNSMTVESFGNIGLGLGAFFSCQNLAIAANDIPKPEKLEDMSFFFAKSSFSPNESNGNSSVGKWDVSNAASMQGMFLNAETLNPDISAWDVSGVTNMRYMFDNATSFNRDISKWNVSNVTNMSYMFAGATSFNRDISEWDVSKVKNMDSMFKKAAAFNQNLSKWNVSNVTDMSFVFSDATSFNQDISAWNVSNVTNMSYMFAGATSFNRDISKWDVSKVQYMSWMFRDATSFNQNISDWNVKNAVAMSSAFYNAESFNQPLNKWDVSNVTNMDSMFMNAASFNQPLYSWKVSKVTRMSRMFHGAKKFNQSINSWDVSHVLTMSEMFSGASSFNQPLQNWNVSNVQDMSEMFFGATKFNQDISGWSLSGIYNGQNTQNMFANSGIDKTRWCKIIGNATFKKYITYIWPGCPHQCS